MRGYMVKGIYQFTLINFKDLGLNKIRKNNDKFGKSKNDYK